VNDDHRKSARPRRKPAQTRAKRLVLDILEATAKVLEEHGAETLSTNKVAARAGVSIGSIYQYFHDKQGLLDGLIRQQYEKLSQVVMTHLMGMMDQPLPKVIESSMRHYVEFLSTSPELSRLMLEQSSSAQDFNNGQLDQARSLHVISAYLIRHEPELRLGNVENAAFMILHVCRMMGLKIASLPTDEHQQMLDELTLLITRYAGYSGNPS